MASAANCDMLGMTWLSVSIVIEIEEWPSAWLTTFGCTPRSSSRVA